MFSLLSKSDQYEKRVDLHLFAGAADQKNVYGDPDPNLITLYRSDSVYLYVIV